MKRAVLPVLFFLYFNALFTFENVPSTPAMRLSATLSVEVLLLLALLAAVKRVPPWLRAALAGLLLAATLVRYVEVTAFGVLGRAFDWYGDFPHLHRVFQMFWEVMSLPLGLLVVVVFLIILALAFSLNWVGLGVLDRVLPRPFALIALAAFALPSSLRSEPVAAVVARQLTNLRAAEAMASVPVAFPPQALDSNLEGLGGANVFIIFLESYGVTLIEDAPHFAAIAPRFEELERNLRAGGYFVRSSQIQSPTFGGGSWRAHATLLSGFPAENERLYDALLASDRKTLVHVLGAHGYRTVAVEPGIKWYWPDGLFYDFDRIYDFDAIDYQGPPMGWWKVPDQFTLYRLYKDEIQNAQAPLFAKFSLIMTHIPYYPVPPYVSDWTRFDSGTAFESGLHSVAHDAYRDLMELSGWYVDAFRYEIDCLEGFLLSYVPDNSLVIILGDHQPPKLATHDNDSWAVPMHVLSKREALVRPFDALGFERELVPHRPSALRMADFLDSFLAIYDVRETD